MLKESQRILKTKNRKFDWSFFDSITIWVSIPNTISPLSGKCRTQSNKLLEVQEQDKYCDKEETTLKMLFSRKQFQIGLLVANLSIFLILSCSLVLGSSAVTINASPPVFGKAINISNDSASAQYPNVQSVGTHVYVAWTERSGGIRFRASQDGGVTWTPSLDSQALRISALGGTTQYPLMSANGSNVYIAWAQSVGKTGLQMFEVTSTNFGLSFGTPVQLTSGSPPGGYIGPVIAAWGNNVYVGFNDFTNSIITCSSKGGAAGSWTLPFAYGANREAQIAAWGGKYVYAISTNATLSVSSNNCASFHKFALNPKIDSEPWIWGSESNFYAAWEGKGNDSLVTVAKTNNNGAIWSTPMSFSMLNNWHPMIGAFGKAAWIATLQHPGGSAAQVFLFTTTNGGDSWNAPVSLSGKGGTNSDDSFPFTVSTSDGSNVFVVWSQQQSPGYWVLRVGYSSNGGITWGAAPGIDVSQNTKRRSGQRHRCCDRSDLLFWNSLLRHLAIHERDYEPNIFLIFITLHYYNQ